MFFSMTGYGSGQATSKKMEVFLDYKARQNRLYKSKGRTYKKDNQQK